MGHMGNWVQGYGVHCNGQWGTGVMGNGAQGYVTHGQWGTGGVVVGPIDNGTHGQLGTGVWGTL